MEVGRARASRGSEGPESPGPGPPDVSAWRLSLGSRLRRGSASRPPVGCPFCRRGSPSPLLLGSPTEAWGRLDVCCLKVLRMDVTLLPPSSSSLEYQFPVSPAREQSNGRHEWPRGSLGAPGVYGSVLSVSISYGPSWEPGVHNLVLVLIPPWLLSQARTIPGRCSDLSNSHHPRRSCRQHARWTDEEMEAWCH